MRILRVHGSKPKYHHHFVGGNFRLDAMQAAVLHIKLELLDTWAAARRENAARYQSAFEERGLIESGHLTPPHTMPHATHVFNQYVIRTSQRDALKATLAERGIGTMIYYPSPLHTQPCFSSLGYREGDFPVAERACREVLALPVYPELPSGDFEYIVDAVCEHFERFASSSAGDS